MLVKINYVEGISGSNVMIFRQRDMQVILAQAEGDGDDLVALLDPYRLPVAAVGIHHQGSLVHRKAGPDQEKESDTPV